MTEPPAGLEGKQSRPALIGLVVVCAAIAFWILGPPPLPGEDPEPASPEVEETPPPEEGGFKDGRPAPPTSPPARAPKVPSAAAVDGALKVVVLGDAQAAQWAPHAAGVLQDRVQKLPPGPFAGAAVEVVVREVGTAEGALAYAQGEGWAADAPELVVVAVGWEDGVPVGAPDGGATTRVQGAGTWLEELAAQSVVGLRAGEARFYLRDANPAQAPLRHLELLDSLGVEAAERGAAVLYLEQPIRWTSGDRRILASTAMRPQPWINTVFGLESQPEPEAIFAGDAGPELSEAGAALLGRFVGLGLVQALTD